MIRAEGGMLKDIPLMAMCDGMCVCVREIERERVCVCVCVKARERSFYNCSVIGYRCNILFPNQSSSLAHLVHERCEGVEL